MRRVKMHAGIHGKIPMALTLECMFHFCQATNQRFLRNLFQSHHLTNLFQLDGRPSRTQRDQIDPTQQLRAIALIAVKMALLLYDRTTLIAGEFADRQVIRQGSGGKKQSAFFAERLGEFVFELLNRPALQISIGGESVLVDDLR